ncbi:MAG: hypothetical protein QUV05_21975 [Phycisphaerae bacterium]|nr:hypothetical protein [Phycisphaerae bacterium]
MHKFMLASTVVLFIVGQTMGTSTVTMELELGGSNNGATCATPIYFTPGSTADGEYALDANNRLTWALRLHASGTHLNASQQEVNIRGVANFVFDLELYHDSVDPANLVTTATFMSTANEVTTDCGIEQNWTNSPAAATYLSNAAFAYVFNMNSAGPARAIDWWAADPAGHKAGGLRMDVRCYPKTVAGSGKLLGMGAGYSRWNKTVISEYSTGGLGRGDFPSTNGYVDTEEAKLSGDSVWGWLGYGPACEGQIAGLQEGVTYILRVVPGGGINVLRNEATSYAEVFAIAADYASTDDTITFTVAPGQPPNNPPVAEVGRPYHGDCMALQSQVALDASASTDPDGDALLYAWTTDCPGAVLDDGTSPTPMLTMPCACDIPRVCQVTVTVSDGVDHDSATTMVTISDITGPVIESVVADPAVLWPPNNKMVPVTLQPTVTDNCDPLPACRVISVTSNETPKSEPDFVITGDLTVDLRATRLGTGTGRTYEIIVECSDTAGNIASQTVAVTVSHDKRK